MTRTIWFGDKPSEKFLEVEKVIKSAYRETIKLLKTRSMPRTKLRGQETRNQKFCTAKDLDEAARSVITNAGYGDKFIHTTGHGLGLEIHEPPSLNFNNEQKIKAGMVITVEPGIYLEGKFGYRYENTVLVTAEGFETLTK